jgi:hypothetical protein
VVAPLLAVLFALATFVVLATSRPEVSPRLLELTPTEGRVRDSTSGVIAMVTERQLRLATGGGDRLVRAGGCAAAVAALQPGDVVTVWLDRSARIWRITKGNAPLCTYVQANAARDATRRNARVVAVVLAVAGVGCAGLTLFSRRRSG